MKRTWIKVLLSLFLIKSGLIKERKKYNSYWLFVVKVYRGAFYFEVAKMEENSKSKGSNVQFENRHSGNYASRPLRN